MASVPPAFPFATAADHDRARALAARLLRRERRGHTLQPTALVHEAWLRLSRLPRTALPACALLALHARAMQRVLVDHARRRRARLAATDVAASRPGGALPATRVRELERCLASLATTAPRLAKVVELRFLAGMAVPEVAAWLGVTERTVVRDWADARVRLRACLGDAGD